jgi:predicted PurR-regulated permease PerM
VENLTIEPKISARAVNVHPAVAFASVMLGASLFGVAGALIAVPVVAMAISLIEVRQLRHEIPNEEPEVGIESEQEMQSTRKKDS